MVFGFSELDVLSMPTRRAGVCSWSGLSWPIEPSREVSSGFASCLAGRSGPFVRLGGSYDAGAKLGLLEGGTAAVSRSQARSTIRSLDSLSSGGLEKGGTPGGERSYCWIVVIS